jgi:hypothetical protein
MDNRGVCSFFIAKNLQEVQKLPEGGWVVGAAIPF